MPGTRPREPGILTANGAREDGAMELNLAGKVVAVTGAGGSLGSAVAKGFADHGSRVALLDTNETKVRQAAREIAGGGRAMAFTTDVRSRPAVTAALDGIEAEWSVPDVLVNAAGVVNRVGFLDETDEAWDRVVDTNLKGTWLCSQLAARRMIGAGIAGVIVNFGSIVSELVDADQVIYGATKGGVRSLTKGMSIALAPHGIRVNAVGPGTIVTDLNRDHLEAHPELLAARLRRTPLGRLGTPEDVVNGVLYLASDVSGFVTGTTLFMEAGRLAQNSA